MIEYAVWISGISKSSRNSEYFPDQPLMYKRFRKEKIVEVKIHRLRNRLGTGTLQNGAWHDQHAGCYCDISRWRRFGTNTPTASFLDFLCLKHAHDTYKHTEQPTTQLGSVSFVDAINCNWKLLNGCRLCDTLIFLLLLKFMDIY